MHENMKAPFKNDSVKHNPNAVNDRAPSALPKMDHTHMRRPESKGNPKPIPSTLGYVGKRIK